MKVKVWNDNIHDFKQKFRDDEIKIPAKKFVELDEDYAHNFVCQYYPPELDAGGVQKPTSYKMLRIEGASTPDFKLDPYTCQACNYKAVNKKDLQAHIEARLGDGKHVMLEDDQKLSPDEIINSLSEDVLSRLTERVAEQLKGQTQPKKTRSKKEDATL